MKKPIYHPPMPLETVISQVKEAFGQLSGQMQVAARFLLDNPQEVALLSMREQARRAGVPAATMTRLAKQFGYTGFDELRAIFVGAVRSSADPFSSRAEHLVAYRREADEAEITSQMIERLANTVDDLRNPGRLAAIADAAKLLSQARTVYVIGQRSAFSVAYHFFYVCSYFSTKVVLLDAPGGTGADPLLHAGPQDALLVISMDPAARKSIEVAHFAHSRGAKIVAITDSPLSPAGRLADVNILVRHDAPSAFFDVMTAAFAAAEALVAMTARLEGAEVPAALRLREQHRRDLGEWWDEDLHAPAGNRRNKRKEVPKRP